MLFILLSIIFLNCICLNAANSFAEKCEFPHEVSVAYQGEHICGGAILTDNFIVTAAHCIKYIEVQDLMVVIGVHDFKRYLKNNILRANRTIIHPQYIPHTRDFDLALIYLQKPLTLFNHISEPIEVMESNYKMIGGTLATLVYWEPDPGTELMYTDIELWDPERCTPESIWGDSVVGTAIAPSNNAVICLAIPEGICVGDDAGSLIVDNRLLGIVSRNIDCDVEEAPVLLTNLAYYRDWLEEIVGREHMNL